MGSFLGITEYFCLWVPKFSLLAKPLYDTSKGALTELLGPNASIFIPLML